MTEPKYTQQVNCIKYFKQLIFNLFPDDLDCWIAGGSIADFLKQRYINGDIDIWFRNQEDYDRAYDIFRTNAELTFSYDSNFSHTFQLRDITIQLIHRKFFETPQDCVNSFDYSICGAGVTRTQFVSCPMFWKDFTNQVLRLQNRTAPMSTLTRLAKYVKRGYVPNKQTFLTLIEQLQSIDLTNPADNDLEYYPDGCPRKNKGK